MKRPLVEILYFDGCPHHEGARELVERVSRELGVEFELRLVNVPDEETARRLRFLGSPTIRVAGTDVDRTPRHVTSTSSPAAPTGPRAASPASRMSAGFATRLSVQQQTAATLH